MSSIWKRLVILDPSLTSHFGHHYNYDQAVVAAARRRGIDSIVVGNRNAAEHVQQSLPALALFLLSSYHHLDPQNGQSGRQQDAFFSSGRELLELNLLFLKELNQFTPHIAPSDMVFFHTLSDIQILGATMWLMSFPDELRPSSNFVLRFLHDRPHSDPLLQLCAANLSAPKMRAQLSTDTTELAALYTHMLRRPVDLIPIPHAPPELTAERRCFLPELAPGTIVIGFVGDCRWAKGFHFVRPLIDAFMRLSSCPVHFLIQISAHTLSPEIDGETAALRNFPSKIVTLVTETLSTEEYYGLMDECNIVLIAYHTGQFTHQSSGVFTEATVAGKVTVLPYGTAMHHEALRIGAGFRTFANFDASSVIEAVAGAVEDYSNLSERAKVASVMMSRYHNGDNLIAYLLGEEISS